MLEDFVAIISASFSCKCKISLEVSHTWKPLLICPPEYFGPKWHSGMHSLMGWCCQVHGSASAIQLLQSEQANDLGFAKPQSAVKMQYGLPSLFNATLLQIKGISWQASGCWFFVWIKNQISRRLTENYASCSINAQKWEMYWTYANPVLVCPTVCV